MLRLVLTSTSEIKKLAIEHLFDYKLDELGIQLVTINCDAIGLPPQPVECGDLCCIARINYAKQQIIKSDYLNHINSDRLITIFIAIENYIDVTEFVDMCCVYVNVGDTQYCYDAYSNPVFFPPQFLNDLQKECGPKGFTTWKFNSEIKGYKKTIGQMIAKKYKIVNDKNWIKMVHHLNNQFNCNGYESRLDQILDPLFHIFTHYLSIDHNIFPNDFVFKCK